MILYLRARCQIMGNPISINRLCRTIINVPQEELLALLGDADSYYSPYLKKTIRKDGSTKVRTIEPSTGYLKVVQRKIDRLLLKPAMESLPSEIMGGRPSVSVIQNALLHADSKALMKYDVKNFFASISYQHVYYIFRYRLNYCEEASNILAKLTTYPSDNPHVPQGAPTSTSLAMFALEPLCDKLAKYCRANDMKFSIWVDDITVSGDKGALKTHRGYINHLVSSTPFTINPDKDSGIIQKGSKNGDEKGRRVTGIIIDNTNLLSLGNDKYKSLKRRVGRARTLSESLRGSLLFLKQVRPSQGKKLYHQYQSRLKSVQNARKNEAPQTGAKSTTDRL